MKFHLCFCKFIERIFISINFFLIDTLIEQTDMSDTEDHMISDKENETDKVPGENGRKSSNKEMPEPTHDLCYQYEKEGKCRFERCKYKHIRICKFVITGKCSNKECKFSHDTTRICKYNKEGRCKYGNKCRYIHAQNSIRTRFEERRYTNNVNIIDVIRSEVEKMIKGKTSFLQQNHYPPPPKLWGRNRDRPLETQQKQARTIEQEQGNANHMQWTKKWRQSQEQTHPKQLNQQHQMTPDHWTIPTQYY